MVRTLTDESGDGFMIPTKRIKEPSPDPLARFNGIQQSLTVIGIRISQIKIHSQSGTALSLFRQTIKYCLCNLHTVPFSVNDPIAEQTSSCRTATKQKRSVLSATSVRDYSIASLSFARACSRSAIRVRALMALTQSQP